MGKKQKSSKLGLLIIIYIAFISLGLPDGLLGVAWPKMRMSFGLPLDRLGILIFGFTGGYLTASFFNGILIKKIKIGLLLTVSCFITGMSLIGYTLVTIWYFLPILTFIAGMGAGAIDAGINTYVEENFKESHMQWLHASFGVGVTLGPIIMTTGLSLTNNWRSGYIVVGIIQIMLSVMFLLTASLWTEKEKTMKVTVENKNHNTDIDISLTKTLKLLPAWSSMALFFLYTGIELSVGHWAYTLLTESREINFQIAGLSVGGYWASFTVGRVLSGFILYRYKSRRLIELGGLTALAGSTLLLLNIKDWLSLFGLVVIGIAIAPIFPALVSNTTFRVGEAHKVNTIGMQIAAAGIGGSLLPALAGVLAKNISIEVIPIFIVVLLLLFTTLYYLTFYFQKLNKI
ncbi:MAG: MFS transporter [Halanaerobiales bacterium]|nr:MFS transporter [Halanaerobiales bacterium]